MAPIFRNPVVLPVLTIYRSEWLPHIVYGSLPTTPVERSLVMEKALRCLVIEEYLSAQE